MKQQLAAACLLGTALASSAAFAQETSSAPASPDTPPPAAAVNSQSGAGVQFLTQMDAEQWRGSKLVGVNVYGSDNSKVGDINEVIIDRNGQAKAIVIGVGGFLGIGEKNVAVSWDKVQWNVGGDQSSGSMVSTTSAGGRPAGDRSTPRDIAQTTTGSPADASAQPVQSAAAGGAALSSAPSSGANANAPANSSSSVAAAPSATTQTATTTSSAPPAGSGVAASASSPPHDYPDRALISMSKQDLQNAPEFRYASQSSSSKGAAGATSAR